MQVLKEFIFARLLEIKIKKEEYEKKSYDIRSFEKIVEDKKEYDRLSGEELGLLDIVVQEIKIEKGKTEVHVVYYVTQDRSIVMEACYLDLLKATAHCDEAQSNARTLRESKDYFFKTLKLGA